MNRVLHIIPHFGYLGGDGVVGGHASALYTLARGQARVGYDLTIAAFVPTGGSPRIIPGPVKLHPLHVRASIGSPRFLLEFLARARLTISSMRQEIDVVHFHSGYADYGVISALLTLRSPIPVIHSLYCRADLSPMSRLPGRRTVLPRALRRVDHVIAASKSIHKSLDELGVNPGSVSIVRPPVDGARFECADPIVVRKALGIEDEELLILFVGNLSKTKNLTVLLSAFGQLRQSSPQFRLVVTTEYQRSDENLVEEALDEAVRSLGVVRLHFVENMPELLGAADVVVTPFLDRSGPSDYFMVALEAMAAGKAVVSSGAGGMAEVLISGENALVVNPTDVFGLARALDDLSDPELRFRIGSAARDTVKSWFSVVGAVEANGRIYQSLIDD